jgi:hypothetical protein
MLITRKHPTLSVLHSYYPEVHSLNTYIRRCIKDEFRKDVDQPDFLLQGPDSIQYRELLNSSFVCLSKETVATTKSPQFQVCEHYDRMKDVSIYISDF